MHDIFGFLRRSASICALGSMLAPCRRQGRHGPSCGTKTEADRCRPGEMHFVLHDVARFLSTAARVFLQNSSRRLHIHFTHTPKTCTSVPNRREFLVAAPSQCNFAQCVCLKVHELCTTLYRERSRMHAVTLVCHGLDTRAPPYYTSGASSIPATAPKAEDVLVHSSTMVHVRMMPVWM